MISPCDLILNHIGVCVYVLETENELLHFQKEIGERQMPYLEINHFQYYEIGV